MMLRINPFAKKRNELMSALEAERKKKRALKLKVKASKVGRKEKAVRSKRFAGLGDELKASFKTADELLAEEAR